MSDIPPSANGGDVIVPMPGGTLNPANFIQPDNITASVGDFATVNSTNVLAGISNDTSSIASVASPAGGAAGTSPAGGLNFGLIGSGISDLFGAAGDADEANAYAKASTLATQNAAYAKESTGLQETQASRQIYQTIGTQQAQVAGAGFGKGGSSQELLRSSQSQGELTKQVIGVQGNINVAGYQAQADAYTAQKQAAEAATNSGIFGGITNILGGVASLIPGL